MICPVKDIASSKNYINSECLKETQAINLKGKVLERLEEKITSANGVGNVTDEKGKRLVAEGTDLKVLQNAEEGIKQMLELAKTMKNDDNAPLKRTSFSIGNTNNKIVARGAVAESYSILNEGLTLGDFLHSVWDGAKQVVEFVVERVKAGVQFVIKIGEQVFNWIVTTIREIGSFIQKIFDAIKVFFEDLFKLLAFLFDWDDIVATKNTFKDFTNEAILSLKGEIGTIKKFVDDNLEEQIGKFRPDKVTFPDELSAVDPSEPSEKTEADPRSNWLNSKKDYLHDSTDKPLKEKIPTEFSDVMQSFLSDMKDILIEAGQGIGSQMETIFAAFKQVLSGNMKFIEFLKLLMNELAVLGLTLVKLLMDLIFKSLETLLDVALVGLNKEWEIPLITQLYKSITKSDELTFLDVMCLFVAIPTTVLYKIGFGKAPFDEGATKEEFVKRGRTIFQLNLN